MRKGFTLIELLVVIVIIGILAAIALPNYIKVKEKAKEAEVKANLHNIQLSVERFAVDTEGAYPEYLIGGEPKYAAQVNTSNAANAFNLITECDPIEGVSDPLLRRGYIDAYPRNPFVRNGVALHRVQETLPSAQDGNDPLRNGSDAPAATEGLGTRFGPYCTSMGSVLADPRFSAWMFNDIQTGTSERRDTWATIEYEFWDMWIGNKPLAYLPGQFFYKGMGPIIAIGSTDNQAEQEATIPMEIDQYMLGGYGGIRTKGKDILGEERQIQYFRRVASGNWLAGADFNHGGMPGEQPMAQVQPPPDPNPVSFDTNVVNIWPWTRSEVSTDPTLREGSPYQPANVGDSNEQTQYGNPNGIRDALIIVLTAGEDYIGDR